MPLLLIKLLVTPALIGGISLFARRWGPALAGWLVALPLTSGPVVTYVALEHGVPFSVEVGLIGQPPKALAHSAATAGSYGCVKPQPLIVVPDPETRR